MVIMTLLASPLTKKSRNYLMLLKQMVSLKMICEYLDKELYTSYDLLGNIQTVSKNAVSKEDFINKLCKEIELC